MNYIDVQSRTKLYETNARMEVNDWWDLNNVLGLRNCWLNTHYADQRSDGFTVVEAQSIISLL